MAYTSNYTGAEIDARLAKTDDIINSVNRFIAETDADGNTNIQTYVVVPEAVMQLAESGTSSADCITAFGGEIALADWVAEVGGGKEVRIKVGNTTIPSTNVSFYEGDDGSVDIDIDYSTDESIHSLDIDITASGVVSILHKTTTRKQVINIPYAVMALATSASGSDIVTAFGGESAMTNIIKAIQNGAMAQLELVSGYMTIYIPFNVISYEENSDDTLNLSATFLDQTTVISILIDDTLTDSAVLSTETTQSQIPISKETVVINFSDEFTITSVGVSGTTTQDFLDRLSGYISAQTPLELSYMGARGAMTSWKVSSTANSVDYYMYYLSSQLMAADELVMVGIAIDSRDLSVTLKFVNVQDSTSSEIADLDVITNVTGTYHTTSSTDGDFPSEIDTNAKKKGVLTRIANNGATTTEGFDIWMSTDSSMSNYVYYRRYSGTGTVTSWFRLLDNDTPDVMHASSTPLTTTSTHLKSGTYAIDDDLTIEGVSAGYGSMLVQMENYTNNTGVRTLTMITGDDAGKTFVSTVITGTYGAFASPIDDTIGDINTILNSINGEEI